MENATKALLIAGTILITIIIVSIAVYLYTMYSNQTKEYSETISAVELQKFNSKFEVLLDRTDITAQELVSVVNLAKQYSSQVKIYLGGSELKFTGDNTPEKFIMENQYELFSCVSNTSEENANPQYDENGKVVKLRFTNN